MVQYCSGIYTKDRTTAFRAFRDNYPRGDPGKGFTNAALEAILAEFLRRTPQLEPSLFSDQGIRLMGRDSQIAEKVLRLCSVKGLTVLCVHDSFIVNHGHARTLKHAMSLASRGVLGEELEVSSNFVGLDEVEGDRGREDQARLRTLVRTEGYLDRRGR